MFRMLPTRFDLACLPRPHFRSFWLLQLFLLLALFLLTTTSAQAAPRAATWPPIDLVTVEGGFDRPIELVSAYDGTGRLFVVEQQGIIYIIEDGERLPTPFLDISALAADPVDPCGECGLLGLAFPPDFAEKGYFFVNYVSATDLIGPDPGDDDPDPTTVGDTVVARFHVTDNPNIADPNSEERILVVNQPAPNHNGGHILFGPDDLLYIGMGDGGGGGDTYQNGQNPASLHGKILRIQVSETATYTIPADNPFVGVSGYREEIWAMGLRNPWRFTFDPVTGDLYVADVGDQTYEEVNYIAAAEINNGDIGNGGMNFGWPIKEGNACFPPSGPQTCNSTGLVAPVITYPHTSGNCSITGGYVYDPGIANQPPVYLYGDLCSGRIWGMQLEGDTWVSTELKDLDFIISSFGENEQKEIFVVSLAGTVYQVEGSVHQSITGLAATNNGPTVVDSPTALTASVTGGTHITYRWDFGDGSNDHPTSATPSHTYTQSGTYTATVLASNATNSMSATTTVYVGDQVVAVTNDQYTPNNFTIAAGETVIWELVEGEHSVTADDGSFNQPLGSDWPPFVHTFGDTFVNAASLNQSTIAYHCTLHPNMIGTLTVQQGGPPPVAGLSAENDGPKPTNEAVAFAATVTGGEEISYTWVFGDGRQGTGATPTHAYASAGIYTATVTAANTTNSMSATTTVYVGDAVVGVSDFTFGPRAITLPVGSTVIWVLRNGTHSVTADDNAFEQAVGSNWTPFVQSFDTIRDYPYHCTLHGSAGGNNMAGTVTIVEKKEELNLPTIRNQD